MRYAVFFAAFLVIGCSSSRPARQGEEAYRVTEEADGSVSIVLDEGASVDAFIAALGEAAALIAWEPPEEVPGLARVSDEDLGTSGHVYSYTMDGGHLNVFVYQYPGDLDAQNRETEAALAQLVDMGRIDAYALRGRSVIDVPWQGSTAELHRAVFEEVIAGRTMDSLLYLLQDGVHWIKVRLSYPSGTHTLDEADATVRALLAG